MKVDLYPHNLETYNKICAMWKTTDKVAAIQATGTGKTYLQLQCLYDYNDVSKVVLAPSNYILDQLLAKSEGKLQNTQLMTYAKLSQMSLNEVEALQPVLIVLDEFHRCGADEWGKGVGQLLESFPNTKVLGTSATPIRFLDGSRDMSDELFGGNIAVNMNLTYAIVKEILPMPKYITALYTFNEEAESLQRKIENSSNDDESKTMLLKELESLKNNLNMSKGIPQILKKHISDIGGKYIVFCKNREHLNEMEPLVIDWFISAGIAKRVDSYRVVHGEISNSVQLQRFRDNTNHPNVRLLFSIEMLNEGIHMDDVTGVILLRPTISPIIHFQQIGRAMQSGNQRQPLIFDFVNNASSIRSGDILESYEQSKVNEQVVRNATGLKELQIPEFNIIDENMDVLQMFAELEGQLIDDWDANFEGLKAYIADHGEYPKPRTKLGWWVINMRSAMRGKGECLLNEHRIDRLNSIKFSWEPLDEKFELDFRRYCEIVETNGHPDANGPMGVWAKTIRGYFRTGRLSQYRIDKLNSINFPWSLLENSWQHGYYELIKYKEEFKHCKVPLGYIVNGFELGKWVKSKKQCARNGTLSIECSEQLNAIGFVWVIGRGYHRSNLNEIK